MRPLRRAGRSARAARRPGRRGRGRVAARSRCCRPTERCGNSATSWNTMPTRRRSGGTEAPAPDTRRPPISMVPASGASSPAIRRRNVVLPQPDGPSTVEHLAGQDIEVDVVDRRHVTVAPRQAAGLDRERRSGRDRPAPSGAAHRGRSSARSSTATVPTERPAAVPRARPPARRSPMRPRPRSRSRASRTRSVRAAGPTAAP